MNAQLRELFKRENRTFVFDQQKAAFEVELHTNDEYAKMYNLLLEFETEDQVKNYMINSAKNLVYNMLIKQWKIKQLKFALQCIIILKTFLLLLNDEPLV